MELKNKIAVVTGGSDGIGRHLCLKLANAGCQVAIIGRNAERLASVVKECESLGSPKAVSFECDISNPELLASTSAKILGEFGAVDILINNAGIWHKTGPLDEIAADIVSATLQTNLTSHIQLTQQLIPSLRSRDEAAILNIISKSGVVAQAGQSVYTASKYGMRGFTEVLKEDEKETGIRVAAIYQSGTNTQMFAKADQDVPNRIFTEPEDLADVAIFMLSRPPKIWMHDVRVEI